MGTIRRSGSRSSVRLSADGILMEKDSANSREKQLKRLLIAKHFLAMLEILIFF